MKQKNGLIKVESGRQLPDKRFTVTIPGPYRKLIADSIAAANARGRLCAGEVDYVTACAKEGLISLLDSKEKVEKFCEREWQAIPTASLLKQYPVRHTWRGLEVQYTPLPRNGGK